MEPQPGRLTSLLLAAYLLVISCPRAVAAVEASCEAGQQYNTTRMTCELCPLGKYNTGNITQRFEQCAPCPEGYVTENEMTGATSIDNCTLRNCPAGTYISGNDCLPCPLATYQDLPRQASCKNCRPNTNTSGEGNDEEYDCTLFCPSGQEQVATGEEWCTACQPDFVRAWAGPGKCDQCTGNFTANDARTACDVLFCDKGFQFNHAGPSCDPCEMGKYKDMRGNTTQCVHCPSNTTTSGKASTSIADCNRANCDTGFYSPSGALPCLACRVGTYKDVTGNMNCTRCPTAFTTAHRASTQASQCSLVVCPIGQYRNSLNQCANCSEGYYQNETGQTGCLSCPPGYSTLGTGADNRDDCKIVCPAGSYRQDSSNTCTPCPVGQYQEQAGQTGCTTCHPSFTTAAAGSNSSTDCYVRCAAGETAVSRVRCEPCPHGQYRTGQDSRACKACDNGSTTLQTGSTSKEQCQPICGRGQYLNMTYRMCLPCAVGTFSGEAGTHTTAVIRCVECPANRTTNNTGAESQSSCNVPVCLPGSFRSLDYGCADCAVGTYQPQSGQLSCILCADGKSTLLPGRAHNKSCVLDCPSGTQYLQASKTCEDCRVGFYRKASTHTTDCIMCEEGTTTVLPGQASCIPQAAAGWRASIVRVSVHVKVRLSVRPCTTGTSFNRQLVGDAIQHFVLNILGKVDLRFPEVCRDLCDNVKIRFQAGCLENLRRQKRAARAGQQDVEIVVEDVESVVLDSLTRAYHESAVVIARAFYDSEAEERELELYGITLEGVENVTTSFSPVPGQGPLHYDGTPAGSVDQARPGHFQGDYGPCPNGTYSSQGLECVPCEKDTYQDLEGQTSCKNCPAKTFTASTAATAEDQCRKKCDEDNASEKYCTGRGTCSFDRYTSNGVRCVCQDGFAGADCNVTAAKVSDVGDIALAAGASGVAVLLLVVIITVCVVIYRRRRNLREQGRPESIKDTQQVGRGSSDHTQQGNGNPEANETESEHIYSEIYDRANYSQTEHGYASLDYSYPSFETEAPSSPRRPAQVHANRRSAEHGLRDFSRPHRSVTSSTRQPSHTYRDARSGATRI